MKIFKLSDLHFGKYTNDGDKWLKLMTDYIYEWFIPVVLTNAKKEDKLVILGDIFDNRNSISVKVICAVIKIFEDLAKIIETHVILGNHDMWLMNSAEINSVAVIRNIPNIFVYDSPKQTVWDNKKILLMPWIHGKNEEKTVLEKYSGQDLLFCHSDLNGCRTQLQPTRPLNRNILDIKDFAGYKRVFSGHIHIEQTINNFTFVGAPYHLDRNDISNQKGIWIYNTKNDKEVFIVNDYSPEFKKVEIFDEKQLTKLNKEEFDKNFVDLHISKSFMSTDPKSRLKIEKIANQWNINDVFWMNDIVDTKVQKIKENKSSDADKSIKEWSVDWVKNLTFKQQHDLFDEIELKDAMQQEIEKCYKIMQTGK